MGTYNENYREAYKNYQAVLDNTEFRSLDEKVNLTIAIGKLLTAAYDFGSGEAKATKTNWNPTSIHEVF